MANEQDNSHFTVNVESKPTAFGWLLAGVGLISIVIVCYLISLIGRGYYLARVQQDLYSALDRHDEIAEILKDEDFSKLLDPQDGKVRKVLEIFSLVSSGKLERARQVIETSNTYQLPARVKLLEAVEKELEGEETFSTVSELCYQTLKSYAKSDIDETMALVYLAFRDAMAGIGIEVPELKL